jgi:hypothetical protein
MRRMPQKAATKIYVRSNRNSEEGKFISRFQLLRTAMLSLNCRGGLRQHLLVHQQEQCKKWQPKAVLKQKNSVAGPKATCSPNAINTISTIYTQMDRAIPNELYPTGLS